MIQGVAMASITLHKLDPELEKRLRSEAKNLNLSLSRTAQKILKESLCPEGHARKKNDFSDLAGTWTAEEAAEFEKNTKEFSIIDEEMWQ